MGGWIVKTCPICKNEIHNENDICQFCGYAGLNKVFANNDEAEIWEDTVVKQCRSVYERMSEVLLREQKIILSYDTFMRKIKNDSWWDFDDVIIHRRIDYYITGQYVNTYFCQYDNPPIEIMNLAGKRDDNRYEMIVSVINLSKETRNRPIKFRYKIITPDGYEIHDCEDDITPAPSQRGFYIPFEYNGKEKPIFEILD